MRTSRTRTLVAALLFAGMTQAAVAQSIPRATPEQVGMSSERLDRLTDALRQYVDEGQLAGAVALVLRRGHVVYFEPFGMRDRESGSAMTPDVMFRIASQSKAIISVAIMMLQEQGSLLISDRLSKYIPEFAEATVAVRNDSGGYDVVDARRPITIRDLLTHTSGLGYGGGVAGDRWQAAGITGWYFADRDEPIAETVSRMASLPMPVQPGERFNYGYSTDVLGVVVERASGMPLDAFLRERIFEPLGMHETSFYPPAWARDRIATVYSATRNGLVPAPSPGGMVGQGAYLDGPRKSFSGGAGLISTAMDYARFLQMMLNGGELDGVRLLSPTTVHLMTVDHLGDRFPVEGAGFGLGFQVTTDDGRLGQPGSIGSFGWGGAYHSTYWVDPGEQLVVVYMTQLNPAGGLDDLGKVRALIYQSIVDGVRH